MTHRDFQNLVSYIDGKVIEIKKLTEELLKNIQTTIKEPILGKKLMAVVESNTQKIKITVDDLYTAIKGNFTKTNGFKSMTDKTMLFSKLPVLGKFKQSVNCSPLSLPNNGTKMVSECKGNSVVGLHKKRISFFNLCKHFNSTTNHARTNVAKATYAGILIYYLYKKIKNTT
ncbi:uncharacterized protein LOC124406608 [Diprion similis]|uniref:uncharacterized protein LOC124406608 n=1 Tax=Diprion similis TaxID=362088 RepID=UPI001EF851A5|nr:uncharacterized protein LOC124406608 [Diprion similis]